MKIKEAVISSINLKGDEMVSHEDMQDLGPLSFSWFTLNLAAMYTRLATYLMSEGFSEFYGREAVGKGKSSEDITCRDLFGIFAGIDAPRHAGLFQHVTCFLNWYLEQDAPEGQKTEDGDLLIWADLNYIEAKWNEYIQASALRKNGIPQDN